MKRIKMLIDRHCEEYVDWHKMLPLCQLLLNTTKHTSTGKTPFFAVFGRVPTGIEQLEDPSLLPDAPSKDMFLRDLKARMVIIHENLRRHSDVVKKLRMDEDNAARHANIDSARVGQVTVGGYVHLLHGSAEQARYIRKHGHGRPWKYKYKVLKVDLHSVTLEVPTDGSVPRVTPRQSIRRVTPARANEHAPGPHDAQVTDLGLELPAGDLQRGAPNTAVQPDDGDPEQVYAIDHILSAEKVGSRYKIWIKWKGYSSPSWEWRHDLVASSANVELLREIDDAVAVARAKYDSELPLPSADTVDQPELEKCEPEVLGRGVPRIRQQPQRLGFEGINVALQNDAAGQQGVETPDVRILPVTPAECRQWEVLTTYLCSRMHAELFLQDRGLCPPAWSESIETQHHVPRRGRSS